MKIPCLECKNRYGKEYSPECNNTCDYAKVVNDNKWLREYKESADRSISKLKDEILGKDYYIVDPVNGSQANCIIVSEVIDKYKAIPKWIRWLFLGSGA